MMMTRKRFTLVEVLMVTGMICIIAALILVSYNGVYRSWSSRNTIAAMKTAQLALDRFRLETGAFPNAPNGRSMTWNTADADLGSLARNLLQDCSPFAFEFANHDVVVFDDFGPKPPSASESEIHAIRYIYPYADTKTFALFSMGKDGQFNNDNDDIIFLPAGLSSRNLKPGFYMVKLNNSLVIQGSGDDIEPLAE